VLEVQKEIRDVGPPEPHGIELISMDELHEIRRIWIYEKRQFDDSLPAIYEEVLGERFPMSHSDDRLLRLDDWNLLAEICSDDREFFQLQACLLDIEREFRDMSRRAGIYETLEERLRVSQYESEEEAIAIRREQEKRRNDSQQREVERDAVPSQPTLFEVCDVDDRLGGR